MKIHILGTSAAEGIPAYACDCATCRAARTLGGPNIRSRSGLVIDNELKVDFGPDTLRHIHAGGLDAMWWKWVVFTHAHDDHCLPSELNYLLPPFAPEAVAQRLQFYGSQAVLDRIRCCKRPDSFLLRRLSPGEPMRLGRYVVTPIVASHGTDRQCYNLIIGRETGSLLYACDTGWYPDSTWDLLRDARLDVVIMECTHGLATGDHHGHLDCIGLLKMRDELERMGALAGGARFVATHFSHCGGALHEELEARLNPEGVEVAYDGKVLEFSANLESPGTGGR